ncbi:MAG: Crp/Fnr family transcriptional regulator [Pseudomonadota bacterium]
MPEPHGPLHRMVRKLEVHAFLSDADRAALLALPLTLRKFERGTVLVREGDLPEHCAVLVSGFACRHKLSQAGARQIVSLHLPGEMLDLQHIFLDIADHNIQTLSPATVATVPRSALRALAETRPAIGHAILVNILIEASIFREWLLNIGRRDARARVAHLLCECAVRLDAEEVEAGQPCDLPMSQDELADALGLTPVHVSRMLRSLADAGLIRRDRRRVSFPRWEELKSACDFNERYLHHGEQIA